MREQSSEQEKPIVLVGKRQGYTISFEIAPNRLECWCTYTPSGMGGSPMSEADLKGFLQQYKILEGVQEESIHRLLHAAATGTAVSNLLLAQGTPMVPGKTAISAWRLKQMMGSRQMRTPKKMSSTSGGYRCFSMLSLAT